MKVSEIKISCFPEVTTLNKLAKLVDENISVSDQKGSIADGKSLLGLMSLDYSHPVNIVCENENIAQMIVKAFDCQGDLEKLFRLINPSLYQ